jgi:hypothetical protein
MVRSYSVMPVDVLERWCAAVNASSRGGLLLGQVSLDTTNAQALAEGILRLIPTWPTEGHRTMMAELLMLTLGGRFQLLRRCKGESANVTVYGPAIDRYWPRVRLGQGLKTDVPGVFVLGDAAGVSRGFVQAMVSGAAWAIDQLGESAVRHRYVGQSVLDRGVQWSVSV